MRVGSGVINGKRVRSELPNPEKASGGPGLKSFCLTRIFKYKIVSWSWKGLICTTMSDSRLEERNPKRENSQSLFSIALTKCAPSHKTTREKGLILAPSFRSQSLIVGEPRHRELKTASQEQRGINAGVQARSTVHLLHSCSVQVPTPRNDAAHGGLSLPTSINSL